VHFKIKEGVEEGTLDDGLTESFGKEGAEEEIDADDLRGRERGSVGKSRMRKKKKEVGRPNWYSK
jgi:hypothetical protein